MSSAQENTSNQELDYCVGLTKAKKKIGEKVKIWHTGGIYERINQTDLIQSLAMHPISLHNFT